MVGSTIAGVCKRAFRDTLVNANAVAAFPQDVLQV